MQGRDQSQAPWPLSTTAYLWALTYGCIFVAANICPYRFLVSKDQQHGWPFAYMLREWRVPGPFTVLYGWWPLDKPPLIWFRPTALLLNVLVGVLLTCLTAFIAEYWVRRNPKFFHLSVRRLIGLIAVVACSIGLLELYIAGGSFPLWFYAMLVCVIAEILVYITPVFSIAAVAHWLVVRSACSERRRRWFGLHWLTWLTLVAFVCSFLHYCLITQTGYAGTPYSWYAYGWPYQFRNAPPEADGSGLIGFLVSSYSPLKLIADISIWLTTIAMTGFVIERWVRRVERGVRTHPVMILALVLVVGFMISGSGK